jgi:hypothetical protein
VFFALLGQKNKRSALNKKFLIIQAASDACASYLRQQMLHNKVASSDKARKKNEARLTPYEALCAVAQSMKRRMRGTKRSLDPSPSAPQITP